MTVISKRFADELTEKEMRDAYLSAQTRTRLVNQIRAIRNQRGWSQGDFAKILGLPQSNVSRLENREYGKFTLTTLFELASAFDCGLIVEFVPYEDFLQRTSDLTSEALTVPGFNSSALEPLCRDHDDVSSSSGNSKTYEAIDAIQGDEKVVAVFDLYSGTEAFYGDLLSGDTSSSGRTREIIDERVAGIRQYSWQQSTDITPTLRESLNVRS